jgi:hypothetical protein
VSVKVHQTWVCEWSLQHPQPQPPPVHGGVCVCGGGGSEGGRGWLGELGLTHGRVSAGRGRMHVPSQMRECRTTGYLLVY